jgi:predicted amidohydrolase YtcJ
MAAKDRRWGYFVILFACATVLFIANRRQKPAPQPADLILMNGRIVTVDARFPTASWIAVRGGRIEALGLDPKGYKHHVAGGTEIVDLGGALAIPGLIESHGHFTGLGESKLELDLTKARSWDGVVALVAEAVKSAKPGEWIQGRGWHQDKWDRAPVPNVDGLPFHDALSRVSPDNPVVLTHASGHSSLANAKAMELSKITATTSDPEGGKIIRDAKGNAIGAFLENAQGLVRYRDGSSTPEEAVARRRRLVDLASKECLAHGVTTFHDAGASFGTIDPYKKMALK